MIPVLFSSSETNFSHNGIGRLIDCLSCKVTEERNGIYECEFQYPINGRLFQQLIQGGIIGVTHDDTGDVQPFDIYKHSAVIDGIVTFNARHISYRLSGICVSPFSANSCADALTAIGTNSVQTNPFTFSTNKTISKIYKTDFVKSARGILMGEQGSLLQAFQGEYKFDKWNVSLLVARGSDTGVTVRYGKNMSGISWDRDDSECFNAVAPYWTDGTTTVTLPEVYVQPTTPITPIVCVPLDMSQMIDLPTVAQLRAEAINYLDTKKPWEPVDKITVDFVAMWQTPEYANVASIQRISLCDTVSIYWTEMGIVAEKAKVVRTVFNVLTERFDEMSVGTVSNEFVAITGEAPGTSIIPITGGGTGANNAADARINLGIGAVAVEDVLPLIKGGTGATDAAASRRNLGLNYAANDIYAATAQMMIFGYGTSGSTQLLFDIVPDKSMEDISSITVQSFNGYVRGINGYLDGANASWTSTPYTATAQKISDRHIRVIITKSSTIANLTNNTPLVGGVTFSLLFS